jgi:hypothetical protein
VPVELAEERLDLRHARELAREAAADRGLAEQAAVQERVHAALHLARAGRRRR